MEKKTVNVSDLLIKSIFIGLIIGILIVFIVHFFGSWSYQSARAGTYSTNTTMPGYYLNCPLDKTHYFKGKGETYDDFFKGGDVNSLNSLKFGAIISATFDGHWKNIFIIGFIAAALIYIFGKVNFQVVKE